MTDQENTLFSDHLKEALNHLYEPEVLRRSPLIQAAGLEGQPNAPFDLQQRLVDAIQVMKPPKGEAPVSRGWRTYYALFYCFVQQFSQAEAATQMGISVRQLRRDQQSAMDTLANILVHKFDFRPLAAPPSQPNPEVAQDELAMLEELSGEREANIDQVLPPLLDTLRTVLEKFHVPVTYALPDDLPPLEVHPVVLRQILLSLINHTVRLPGMNRVNLQAASRDSWVEVLITAEPRPYAQPPTLKKALQELEASTASTAGSLTRLSGGTLEMQPSDRHIKIRLQFPSIKKTTILVIDDNPDLVHLLRRYVLGSRFHIIGTQSPEEIFPLAESYQPRAILLDIMMPKMDGWEVLSRLRQHPATCQAAILICSILNEPALALELGATGFLRKPVNRQEFLMVLEGLYGNPD